MALEIEWGKSEINNSQCAARLRFAETHETGVGKYIKQENSRRKQDETRAGVTWSGSRQGFTEWMDDQSYPSQEFRLSGLQTDAEWAWLAVVGGITGGSHPWKGRYHLEGDIPS